MMHEADSIMTLLIMVMFVSKMLKKKGHPGADSLVNESLTSGSYLRQARKALADRQKELELKTQQLEIKLSNKIEEDIKKARRKSTQAGQSHGAKVEARVVMGSTFTQALFALLGRREHCPLCLVKALIELPGSKNKKLKNLPKVPKGIQTKEIPSGCTFMKHSFVPNDGATSH